MRMSPLSKCTVDPKETGHDRLTDIGKTGTFALGDRTVNRFGYGDMQLAGLHVFGRQRTATAPSPCTAMVHRARSP